MRSLARLSASELVALLDAGELSSVELVDSLLARIRDHDRELGAFVEVYGESARGAARAADAFRASGAAVPPLHGVPIALKDVVHIKGSRTSLGSAALAESRSTRTAEVVRRIEATGMIVIGKVTMVEFAAGSWGTNKRLGTPRNPWDPMTLRVPGGSSSGCGVALAAGLVPLALGTDTGGSGRIPAAWCGVSALRVSRRRISTRGVAPLSRTLDTPSPMARSARDLGLLLDALAVRSRRLFAHGRVTDAVAHEPVRALRGIRIGHITEQQRRDVHSDVLSSYDESLAVLAAAGAELVPVGLPFEESAAACAAIINAEGYREYRVLLEDEAAPLDEDVRERLLIGRTITATGYRHAQNARRMMSERIRRVFRDFHAVVSPTTVEPPPALELVPQQAAATYFTRLANLVDVPALALPNGFTRGGLPTSLQIITGPGAESTALALGRYLQTVTDWHLREPPGWG